MLWNNKHAEVLATKKIIVFCCVVFSIVVFFYMAPINSQIITDDLYTLAIEGDSSGTGAKDNNLTLYYYSHAYYFEEEVKGGTKIPTFFDINDKRMKIIEVKDLEKPYVVRRYRGWLIGNESPSSLIMNEEDRLISVEIFVPKNRLRMKYFNPLEE